MRTIFWMARARSSLITAMIESLSTRSRRLASAAALVMFCRASVLMPRELICSSSVCKHFSCAS